MSVATFGMGMHATECPCKRRLLAALKAAMACKDLLDQGKSLLPCLPRI